MPRLNYSKNGQYLQNTNGWIFIVEGRGHFPTDMLRYDQCFPVYETEANMIRAGYLENKTRVSVKTNSMSITPDRWSSFGWIIVEAYPLNKDGRKQSESGIYNGQFLTK